MVNLAQLIVRTELQDAPAVLAGLRPEFHEMRACVAGDGAFLTVSCDNPSDAHRRLVVSFRVGERHQFLFMSRSRRWAIRRVEILYRLALKRLARLAQNRIS